LRNFVVFTDGMT